ncbi:MAG: kynureninase [Paracoccaceae bacterium]
MVNTLHKKYRPLFYIPQNWIYLDGNSLGPLQKSIINSVSNVITNEWGRQIIKGWNKANWMAQPDKIGNQIAKLIGANKDSVTIGDSLAIKLFQAISGAVQVSKNKGFILSDDSNFPSDLYIANSYLKEKNLPEVRVVHKTKIEDELQRGDISILMLTHVDYRTGEIYNLKKINNIARDMNIITVWDFAHSVGALPLNVKENHIDFAVGCTYKYLSCGPGSPAFLYVKPKHINKIDPVIAGWLGHENPFNFDLSYKPAKDIKRFRIGTPPVIQMAALEEALKMWDNVDINLIRKEAQLLTSLFINKIEHLNLDMKLISPKSQNNRGNQVAYQTENAFEKMQALIDYNVIGDYREPNIMRFGFNPLYNSEKDVNKAIKILKIIFKKDIWKNNKYSKRNFVT